MLNLTSIYWNWILTYTWLWLTFCLCAWLTQRWQKEFQLSFILNIFHKYKLHLIKTFQLPAACANNASMRKVSIPSKETPETHYYYEKTVLWRKSDIELDLFNHDVIGWRITNTWPPKHCGPQSLDCDCRPQLQRHCRSQLSSPATRTDGEMLSQRNVSNQIEIVQEIEILEDRLPGQCPQDPPVQARLWFLPSLLWCCFRLEMTWWCYIISCICFIEKLL